MNKARLYLAIVILGGFLSGHLASAEMLIPGTGQGIARGFGALEQEREQLAALDKAYAEAAWNADLNAKSLCEGGRVQKDTGYSFESTRQIDGDIFIIAKARYICSNPG